MRKVLMIVLVVAAMLVCAPAAAQIGNVSDEAHPFSVTVIGVSCFTDFHFFSDWETTITAGWERNMRKVVANRYRVLAFDEEGWLVAEAPMGVGSMDLTGFNPPFTFKVEQRFTGERTSVAVVMGAIASCSFFPPLDGSAWVWSAEHNAFVLRTVPTTGPPHSKADIDLQWSYR